ncbi:MAG: hypothetical protein ACQGVK_08005 [Myxococcota bacterium]
MLVLWAALLVGCAKPTRLKVVSDPPGARVEIGGLGAIGKTPLRHTFTRRELANLDKTHGKRVNLPISLSMPAYLTDRTRVRVELGDAYTHFVQLEPRAETVSITTDPEGVGVYELTVDAEAAPAVHMLFDANPMEALEKHGKWITRHYIGATPVQYEYDPRHPLDQNDVLLFQKAGFQTELGYFKEREERIHVVMMPHAIEER